MYHPTTRVLAVLELLQARGRLSGPELAERLEVDLRTVRRYVTMLQDLGIPVEAERGRHGGYRLRPGDRIRWVAPAPRPVGIAPEAIPLDLVHEDDDLLVVNKPAGLVCHPTRDGELSSLVGRVRLHLGNSEGRLVNRLDRETSGVVLIAKNAQTAGALGKLLAASGARKEYWAIVHGHVEADDLTIDAALGKDEHSAVAIKDAVRPDGAAARTDIRVERRF